MKSFYKATLCTALMASILAFTPVHADTLPETFTPMGALRAGNADGSIPAWTGGITTPPEGYTPGDHHPDPFPEDAPLFVITKENMAQYGPRLTEGHKAMLERYDSFRMPVYKTRRTASAPQRIYDATMRNATTATLTAEGNGVEGASEGIPFPIPRDGLDVIWNHLLRWRGVNIVRHTGQANPTSSGDFTFVLLKESLRSEYSRPGGTDGNVSIYFLQEVTQPARLAGEILLVHETINQVAEPRAAWTYNPGQRRVRRAPNIAYDNPGTASDGLRTSDNLDMFNGAPDKYDWTLVGREEFYVPYNAYRLHAGGLAYDEILKPLHLNTDLLRYELHRVWVVEATLKDGEKHIYAKRRFYVDEDSWQIVAVDHYDNNGQLWRVAEAHGINYYDVPVYWTTLDVIYDLQASRYTALGLDNNEPMYDFNADLSPEDFTPMALRRKGKR